MSLSLPETTLQSAPGSRAPHARAPGAAGWAPVVPQWRRRHQLTCGTGGGSGACRNWSGNRSGSRAIQALRAAAAAAGDSEPSASPPPSDKLQPVVLLDLVLPAPPGAVCAAIFGAGSIGANTSQAASSSSSSSDSQGLLPCFLVEELGCTGLAANPWLPSTTCDRDARRQRRLRYATPLSLRQRLLLPLGPAAVQNEEEQQAAASSDGSGSIKVSCRVSSAGVPFADCFASYLLWQLAPAPAGTGGGGSSSTRLVLTASCTFHKPVLGPLRGQIEGESIQGMLSVYSRFSQVLQQHFSSSNDANSSGISNATSSSCMSGELLSSSAAPVPAERRHSSAWREAQALVTQSLTVRTAAGALQQAEALWPAWSAAGCRLRPSWRLEGSKEAPTAEEAAAVLALVARRGQARSAQQRQQELAKSRGVRGLVEALRLLPLRTSEGGSGSSGSVGGSAPQSAAAVSASLWALAVLGGSIFFEAEAEALCALLPTCRFSSLRQVSDTAWALATMRHYTPHLLMLEQQAADVLEQQLPTLQDAYGASQPDISSSDGANNGTSSDGAISGSQQQPRPPSLSQLATVVWGLAVLGHSPLLLLPLLPAVLQARRRASLSSDGEDGSSSSKLGPLCTLAWSLAVANCLQHPAAATVAAELASAALQLPAGGAKRPQLLQLHQFVLALEQAAQQQPGGSPAAAALHHLRQHPSVQQLLAAAAAAWKSQGQQRGSVVVSACQADVARTARSGLGLAVVEEHSVAGWSVDVAVPSRQLAIEVDGPSHYCRNAPASSSSAQQESEPLPLGSTLLKRRLLEQQGWAVVSVNAAQWEALRGGDAKRWFLAAGVAAAEAARQ